MESLFLLVPIALIFVAIALKIFFWAIKSGQYDNLDTEAHRILFDEDENDAQPAAKPKADPGQKGPRQ
ncbi:cbb3-type cytochrome oxidase assembly protein CcoS [Marinimicrobium agarilyticum]|uniref:cbb3-type cytochrome oxidase assembly protein CcoS n=1 Tax=Marinimicrobium agarilyticum TaxID=306546 RepID=UPI0003FC90B4|nr:cbb3-type cytochrome oxidase assembly protein CcoS [Marinimicrobium agarilyticum]